MPGLTNTASAQALDAVFPNTGSDQYVAYGTSSTTESTAIARTAIGTWNAATSADPSVKSNANALTSAPATGSATITHFAVFSASTSGTQLTDWTALSSSKTVAVNDTLTWAAGALQITLT